MFLNGGHINSQLQNQQCSAPHTIYEHQCQRPPGEKLSALSGVLRLTHYGTLTTAIVPWHYGPRNETGGSLQQSQLCKGLMQLRTTLVMDDIQGHIWVWRDCIWVFWGYMLLYSGAVAVSRGDIWVCACMAYGLYDGKSFYFMSGIMT